jgi:hypothetical protein
VIEIVDIKTRRKTQAPIDEPEVKLSDFLKDAVTAEDDASVIGAILVTWDQNAVSNISHFGATWMEILWFAHELARYATEDEIEEEE